MTGVVTQDVPMRVVDARRSGPSVDPAEAVGVTLLDEIHGDRRLAIWIGPDEATEIALALKRVASPRPGPSDFAAALLTGAGSGLRKVRVSGLRGALFYAQAELDNGAVIDARPSDVLTLALVLDAPVYVDEEVLEKAVDDRASGAEPPAWASYQDASQLAEAFKAFYAEQRALRRDDLPPE